MSVQITVEVPLSVDHVDGVLDLVEADAQTLVPKIAGKCLVLRTYDDPDSSIEFRPPGCEYVFLVNREELRRALDIIDKATVEPKAQAA